MSAMIRLLIALQYLDESDTSELMAATLVYGDRHRFGFQDGNTSRDAAPSVQLIVGADQQRSKT